MPSRSRTRFSSSRSRSQSANANIPTKRRRAASRPQRSMAASIVSVSECPRHVTPFEFVPQLEEVVDLAVERDHEPPARREHRLVTFGREVEDREAAVAERDLPVVADPDPRVVGPPVHQRRDHPARVRSVSTFNKTSCQSTHNIWGCL